MVIVKNYHLRTGEDGGEFVTLEIEGDLELVQSQNTGRFYATARRCFIFSTFDQETAERMIGSQMPGRIIRVPKDPFDYTIPETGEVIVVNHGWEYIPEERLTAQVTTLKMKEAFAKAHGGQPVLKPQTHSSNNKN